MKNIFCPVHFTKNILAVENVDLEQLIETAKTPAYVYSKAAMVSQFRSLKNALSDINPLICFAVKANSNLSILRLFVAEGSGFDVVSAGELHRAVKAGGDVGKIVFSGIGKTATELEMALLASETGILSFNIESRSEIELLNKIAIKHNKKARASLRFNPNIDALTHPYISTGLKRNKFGLTKSEILEIAGKSDTLKGITIDGISIHIGSQILSLKPLDTAFSKLKIFQMNSLEF